jgi:GH25 family lysozyme M1 (1,4-beta-N-acetylmuramidase)
MIYFNSDHSYHNIYLRELTDYRFWLAQYNTVLNYPYKIDMWQYTETGAVPGISGDVDINLFFPWKE